MHTTSASSPVVVVGAGLAGVSCALALADAGLPVLLYERSSRVGGRAASHCRTDGAHTPLGSHLFLRCCTEYIRLLDRLGTRDLVRLQPRLRLMVASAGRSALLNASGLPHPFSMVPALLRYPFLSPTAKWQVTKGLTSIVRGANPGPNESWAAWLARHKQPVEGCQFFWELISAPTLNAPAASAAAEYALMVFRLAVMSNDNGAALGFLPSAASGLLVPIANYLAQRRGQLRLRSQVLQVGTSPPPTATSSQVNGAPLWVRLREGAALQARAVVLAVTQTQILRLLPTHWAELPVFARAASLPSRPVFDAFIRYDRPVMPCEVTAIPGLPALWLFPEAPLDGTQTIAVSISCPDRLVALPQSDIVQWVHTQLGQAIPAAGKARLLEASVQKHARATFSVLPEHRALRPGPRTPVPGLFLAGDWTATGWPATMEGAVRSGAAAAQAVLAYLG